MERIIYTDEIDSNLSEEDKDYCENYWFNDETINLKKITEGNILAIADLGLWDGRHQGYSLTYNKLLSDILYIGNPNSACASIKVFYDGKNVRKTIHHHDGINHVLFREVRPNVNIHKLCDKIYNGETISNSTLNYYTRSLKRYVKDIYGW